MRNKKLFVMAFLLLALVAVVGTVAAITDGELDGDGHPYVGLMAAFNADGEYEWRCSGTLISPKVFLTAGHCTEPPAVRATIFFESDVESQVEELNYPYGGKKSAGGKVYGHPDYDPDYFWLHDLGVVILDKAVEMPEYGALPEEGILDEMANKRGQQDVTFTAVGYGLQRINPVFEVAEKVRMVAYPKLNQINSAYTGDYSILLSNNHSTGGTCFGDSGGPNFIGDSNVVGGVTSFGNNGNCAGTGGVYRVDTADDLDWLYSEFSRELGIKTTKNSS